MSDLPPAGAGGAPRFALSRGLFLRLLGIVYLVGFASLATQILGLIGADGLLFVLSDQGRLVLLEATPDSYVERGSVQALEGRCWTAPTLSGGKLYLRNNDEIVAYDVKG